MLKFRIYMSFALFLGTAASSYGMDQSKVLAFNPEIVAFAKKVSAAEIKDDASLIRLGVLFEKRSQECKETQEREPDAGCAPLLFETDLLPNGRIDHVLLFRGENGRFETPGISRMALRALRGSKYCPGCTDIQLRKLTIDKFSELQKSCVTRLRDTVFHFDVLKNTWLVEDRPVYSGSGYVDPSPNPPKLIEISALPAHCDLLGSPNRRTIADLLVGSHVVEEGFRIDNDPVGFSELMDPLVSYSSNPATAVHFASDAGRVLILSVPKTYFEQESTKRCSLNADLSKPSFIDTRHCSGGDTYDFETEYDFFMETPSELLLKSYVISSGAESAMHAALERAMPDPVKQTALDTVEYIEKSGFTEIPKESENADLFARFCVFRDMPGFQEELKKHTRAWTVFENQYLRHPKSGAPSRGALIVFSLTIV